MMKVFSMFLLAAGWFLVVTAIALLRSGFLAVFVLAGMGVELLGLALLTRAHTPSAVPALSRQGRRY